MGKRRILMIAAAVMVLAGLGTVAGTALNMEQPASAQISIEGIGGNSPTFNVIDNENTGTAGGKAGHIDASNDNYVVDLDGMIFGSHQTFQVGSDADPIFTLQNNYGKRVLVKLVGTDPVLGSGWKYTGPKVVADWYMHFRRVPIYPDHPGDTHWAMYIGVFNNWQYQTFGVHAIDPGELRKYYLTNSLYGPVPAGQWKFNLAFQVSENVPDLTVWAQQNLVPNDALFDDDGQMVYHKTADGSSVEVIPYANFDEAAWMQSFSQ